MRIVEIVKVDTRGRITMPTLLRETLGIAEGMHVMLIGDIEKHEIRILPFADPEAELIEIQITLIDKPGSLAKIASVLAEKNIDLLTSQSRTLRRTHSAEWFVVADVSKSKISLEQLSKVLIETAVAEKVVYKKFE